MLKYIFLLIAAVAFVVVCRGIGYVVSFKTNFLDLDIGFWSGIAAGVAITNLINVRNLR